MATQTGGRELIMRNHLSNLHMQFAKLFLILGDVGGRWSPVSHPRGFLSPYRDSQSEIYYLGSSITNIEPMQYWSVAVKGCSFQLYNEDWAALVPV